MDAIKLFDYDKFVVKQLEEREDSLKKKSHRQKRKNVEKKGNIKEEEIENEFVDEILKKKRKEKGESAIFKKHERIN